MVLLELPQLLQACLGTSLVTDLLEDVGQASLDLLQVHAA